MPAYMRLEPTKSIDRRTAQMRGVQKKGFQETPLFSRCAKPVVKKQRIVKFFFINFIFIIYILNVLFESINSFLASTALVILFLFTEVLLDYYIGQIYIFFV